MTFFMDNNFDFPEKYNCSGEIYKFIKNGFKYDSLEKGFQHLNADLDVSIKSPILLFPIDILHNLNKKFILIRCGDFNINSILPPREDITINDIQTAEQALKDFRRYTYLQEYYKNENEFLNRHWKKYQYRK